MTNIPAESARKDAGTGAEGGDAIAPHLFDARLAPPAHPRLGLPVVTRKHALAAAAIIAALVIAVSAHALLSGRTAQDEARLAPTPGNAEPGEPIDIAPGDNSRQEGVTVLAKQQESPSDAPVAAGSQAAQGHAIDLGAALSFSELSRRFAEIALQNQEIPFDRLEPRATLRETATGLEARLMVGPFASVAEAEAACLGIALPSGIDCRVEPFAGELIARE